MRQGDSIGVIGEEWGGGTVRVREEWEAETTGRENFPQALFVRKIKICEVALGTSREAWR